MTSEPDRFQRIASELARVDGSTPGQGDASPKHRKMVLSPFQFLRGSAQLFYADLASGELALPRPLQEAPLTYVQGDCHFSNFGFFTEEGSHGERVVWGPNDFDDAGVGHAAFDLLRFCVSLHLVGGHCRGLVEGRYQGEEASAGGNAPSEADAATACRHFLAKYRSACEALTGNPDECDHPVDEFPKKHVLARSLARARRRAAGGDRFATRSSLGKAARLEGGRLRFRDRPERFARLDDALETRVRQAFRPYVDDEILDVVRRLGAGTGSVDVDRYYLLVGPAGPIGEEDLPLAHIVEAKQQREAALIHHFPDLSPVNGLTPAHLTVASQRQMMRRPDLILDDLYWEGAHWLVRSRHHARLGVDPEVMLAQKKPLRALRQYAGACAESLARAHARGDRRSTRFERAMADALARAAGDVEKLARQYARRTVQDHRLLCEALAGTA